MATFLVASLRARALRAPVWLRAPRAPTWATASGPRGLLAPAGPCGRLPELVACTLQATSMAMIDTKKLRLLVGLGALSSVTMASAHCMEAATAAGDDGDTAAAQAVAPNPGPSGATSTPNGPLDMDTHDLDLSSVSCEPMRLYH